MAYLGINSAAPEEWDRLRKAHPAVEVTTTVIEPSLKSDPVASPSHYNTGNIECIAAIKESMSAREFKGYLKGNSMKYLWRYDYKGKAKEDLKKAQWYLDKLIGEF
tara:strand:+ start:3175 stop:3492 length:318 start_codon:yes stop_codon:yes gene_type:complete